MSEPKMPMPMPGKEAAEGDAHEADDADEGGQVILPACFSGYDHDWVDASSISESAAGVRVWICARCDVMVRVDSRERIRRGDKQVAV